MGKKEKIIVYKSIENVEDRYLDRLLIETVPFDELSRLLMKDIKSQTLKLLRMKHKIVGKSKSDRAQLIKLALDFVQEEKSKDFYQVLMKCLVEDVVEQIKERFGFDVKFDDLFASEEGFLRYVEDILDVVEVPHLVSYIRNEHEEIYNCVGPLLKSWQGTEDFKKYAFESVYNFKYDNTFKEEFGFDLNFDCLERSVDFNKEEFELQLDEMEDVVDGVCKLVSDQLKIMADYVKKKDAIDSEKVKLSTEVISQKEKELTKANRSIKSLEKELEKLKEEIEDKDGIIEDFESKVESLHSIIADKTRKLEEDKGKRREEVKEIKIMKREFEDAKSALASRKDKIEKMNLEMEDDKVRLKEVESSYKELLNKYDALVNSKNEMEQDYRGKIEELERSISYAGNVSVEVATGNEMSMPDDSESTGNDTLDLLDMFENEPTFR